MVPTLKSDEQREKQGDGENEKLFVYGFTSSTMMPLENGVRYTQWKEKEGLV